MSTTDINEQVLEPEPRPQIKSQLWSPPVPFSEQKPSEEFPLDTLPSWLRDWAVAIAANSETPPDAAASLGLAVAASAIAGKVIARVDDGWDEQLSHYMLIVMESGARKSSIFNAALAPVRKYEKFLIDTAKEAIAVEETERDVLEMALRRAKSEAASAAGTNAKLNANVIACRQRLNAAQVRAIPQLVAVDFTPEGLVRALAEQNERISVLTDEGEVVKRLISQAGIDLLLKCYDAGDYRVNRAGKPPIVLEKPTLVIAAAVQPVLLEKIANNEELHLRGLLGRFIVVRPQSQAARRTWNRNPISPSVLRAYATHIRNLAMIDLEHDNKGRPKQLDLVYEPKAVEMLRSYGRELDQRIAWGDLAHMRAFGLKQAGRVARLAALLHIARNGLTAPVTVAEMENAIRLGEYFIAHTRSAYVDAELDPTAHLAHRILKLASLRCTREFSKSICNVALRPKTASMTAAFELLQRCNYIRPVQMPDRKGSGRRPDQLFELNPMALGHSQEFQEFQELDEP